MKRWPIIVLLLLVAGSSATAVYYYRENVALRRQLAAQTAAVEVAKAAPAPEQAARVAAPEESAAVEAGPAANSSADRPNNPNRGNRGNRGAEAMARVLNDPEMREAMLTRAKTQIDRMYGGLFLKLGLNEDQTEMLRSLLAERQLARMQGGMMERTSTDDASREQARVWRDAQDKSIDAGIASILGPDASKILNDYQRTMPQRQAVDEINQRASYAGAPLTADASDRLVQVIAAAQEAVPVPNDLLRPNWQGGGRGQNDPSQQQQQRPPLTQEAVDQYVAAQQAQNQQILEQARGFLSQAQLEALASQQLDQLEQTQAQLNFRLKNPDVAVRGGFGGPGGGFGGPGGGFRGGGRGRNGGAAPAP